MKVTQEKLPNSQIGLEIEISVEKSQKTYDRVIQDLARNSNIPGFRKGKVPRPILIQRIGSQRIKGVVLEQLVQEGVKEALEQEKITTVGDNFELKSNLDELIAKYSTKEPFVFSAAVEIPPSVTLEEYRGLSVKAEEFVYDPQEVDEYIEQMRSQNADLAPVENRPAQMSDVALIDFKGKLAEDGTEIEGGSAENYQVELAEGQFIPGLLEGVEGMNIDETKDIEVTFPEDYGTKELAGKPAIFTITLKELKTKDLPDLDDDFAEDSTGGEYTTFASLREHLEKQFQEKVEASTKDSINKSLQEILIEKNTVDVPESMIQDEITEVLTQTLISMQQMGLDVKNLVNSGTIPKLRENARGEAVVNLQKKLILKEIAERENLVPDEDSIEKRSEEIKAELQEQVFDEPKLLKMVTEDLLAENTFNWLRENNQIELVPPGSLSPTTEETETTEDSSESPTENVENQP